MSLLPLAIGYLILVTASNAATLLTYTGPNYLIAFGGIFVKLLEYYIVFVIAKRHANPKTLLLFKVYWGLLVITAGINIFVHGQLNYVINSITLIFYLILMTFLFSATVNSKILKAYAALKIAWILYSASLFFNALMGTDIDASTAANTIAMTLLLSFISDCILVAVAWWSQKTISHSQHETNQ
jgi:hypothetical protein